MIAGQTHPDFPGIWSANIAEQARAQALLAYPREAVGIVEAGVYVPLENISANPESEVALSDADMVRAANAQVFFHSHPNSNGCPSAHDMEYQQQLGIPFVILSIPEMDMFCFGDQCGRSPLLNRGFRHGVHDCMSLIRDWYYERGVDIINKPRDWEWWNAGGNLYMDNFTGQGFKEIKNNGTPQLGDVYLFQFNYKVPMHGALVVEDGLLLHHPAAHRAADPTRLSTKVPRQRYLHLVTHRLRHYAA